MNIDALIRAAKDTLRLLSDYQTDPANKRELRIDPVLYGLLQGRFGHMSRQHYVRMLSKPKPQRIDFRYGTTNPAVIEFAVRPPGQHSQLYGSQNRSELRKLTRVVPAQAKRRYLLLLDLASKPIRKSNLKPTYDSENSGPGNFQRHPVRVVYVHHGLQYHFLWKPV